MCGSFLDRMGFAPRKGNIKSAAGSRVMLPSTTGFSGRIQPFRAKIVEILRSMLYALPCLCRWRFRSQCHGRVSRLEKSLERALEARFLDLSIGFFIAFRAGHCPLHPALHALSTDS